MGNDVLVVSRICAGSRPLTPRQIAESVAVLGMNPMYATLAGGPPLHNNGGVRDVVFLCPPGFEEVVSDAAVRELASCVESSRSHGLVRLQTDTSDRELRTFPCATNALAVIAEVPRGDIEGEAKSLAEW